MAAVARLEEQGWQPAVLARRARAGKLIVQSINVARRGTWSHFELHVGEGRMLRFSMPTSLVTTEFLWSFVGPSRTQPVSGIRLRVSSDLSSPSEEPTLAERATRARHGGKSLASRWHEWADDAPPLTSKGSPAATLLTAVFCFLVALVLAGGCS